MKKILIAFTGMMLTQVAMGAAVTIDENAAGSVTSITNAAAECPYIKEGETVKISLSANVAGAYDCDTNQAGFAAGSVKGKGRIYSVSSNGGIPAESTDTAVTGIRAAVGSKATTAKTANSGS